MDIDSSKKSRRTSPTKYSILKLIGTLTFCYALLFLASQRGQSQQEPVRHNNEHHAIQPLMHWDIPNDLQEARYKECEGGRKTSSTGGFCLTEKQQIGGYWMVDTALGEYLRDNLFRGMDVIDLGAGLGHYGKIFLEKGSPVKSWIGYDGAMNVQKATNGLVKFMDLT